MRATNLHPSRKERNEDLTRATAPEEIPVYLRRYADEREVWLASRMASVPTK